MKGKVLMANEKNNKPDKNNNISDNKVVIKREDSCRILEHANVTKVDEEKNRRLLEAIKKRDGK